MLSTSDINLLQAFYFLPIFVTSSDFSDFSLQVSKTLRHTYLKDSYISCIKHVFESDIEMSFGLNFLCFLNKYRHTF